MEIKQYFALLFILFTFFSLSSHSMSTFDNGQEFRRIKSNSPIFLRYSTDITVTNYGLDLKRKGFEIYTYNDIPAQREKVGYVTYEICEEDNIVEIAWVKINDDKQGKGYATEALQTLISLMKKKRTSHFSDKSYCFLTVGESRKAMQRVAIKLGFKKSNRFFCPPEISNFILPLNN